MFNHLLISKTKLDDIAEHCQHGAPQDLARLGFAVAHALDKSAPAVEGLDEKSAQLAVRIAEALGRAKRPLLIAGTSLGDSALLHAAANIAKALHLRGKNGSLSLVVNEANSLGLALQGGKPLDSALEALAQKQAAAVLVLENDLYRRAEKTKVDAALSAAELVIVCDHQRTATSEKAHLLLPAASFAEGDGTLVSQEGRAQRFFQVFEPSYYDPSVLIRESWRWLHALHSTLQGKPVDWTLLDQVTAACAASHPALATIVDAAPSAITSNGVTLTSVAGFFHVQPVTNPGCGIIINNGVCVQSGNLATSGADRNLRYDGNQEFPLHLAPEYDRINLFATTKYDLSLTCAFFAPADQLDCLLASHRCGQWLLEPIWSSFPARRITQSQPSSWTQYF